MGDELPHTVLEDWRKPCQPCGLQRNSHVQETANRHHAWILEGAYVTRGWGQSKDIA